MKVRWWLTATAALAVLGGAVVPLGDGPVPEAPSATEVAHMDLSGFSPDKPEQAIDLLFLHHSVGGQWLASAAEDPVHGGGLRAALESQGYRVHTATYGSRLGERTDLFDWPAKFRDSMQDVLRIDRQDGQLAQGGQNRVVMFKSCFPNNHFVGAGVAPGDPAGPELTLENARAALRALLPEFQKQPNVLFVYVTAPPLAPRAGAERAYKRLAKKLLGRTTRQDELARTGPLARRFNDWVTAADGWLAGYPARNVAVFDYYGVLTDSGTAPALRGGASGASHFLRYPTAGGFDSHPSKEGQAKATAVFVPWLNRAVRRAGLVAPDAQARADDTAATDVVR
jgi:hypothetical protein